MRKLTSLLILSLFYFTFVTHISDIQLSHCFKRNMSAKVETSLDHYLVWDYQDLTFRICDGVINERHDEKDHMHRVMRTTNQKLFGKTASCRHFQHIHGEFMPGETNSNLPDGRSLGTYLSEGKLNGVSEQKRHRENKSVNSDMSLFLFVGPSTFKRDKRCSTLWTIVKDGVCVLKRERKHKTNDEPLVSVCHPALNPKVYILIFFHRHKPKNSIKDTPFINNSTKEKTTTPKTRIVFAKRKDLPKIITSNYPNIFLALTFSLRYFHCFINIILHSVQLKCVSSNFPWQQTKVQASYMGDTRLFSILILLVIYFNSQSAFKSSHRNSNLLIFTHSFLHACSSIFMKEDLDIEQKYKKRFPHSCICNCIYFTMELRDTTIYAIIFLSDKNKIKICKTHSKKYAKPPTHSLYRTLPVHFKNHNQQWNNKDMTQSLPLPDQNLLPLHQEYNVRPINRFLPDALNNPTQDMAYLGYRLATLSALPPSVPVSRVRLANAGFYFRGQGDEVICYRCQGRHSGWTAEDHPMDVHRKISPSCSHVIEMDRETSAGAHQEPTPLESSRSPLLPNGFDARDGGGRDHPEDGEQRGQPTAQQSDLTPYQSYTHSNNMNSGRSEVIRGATHATSSSAAGANVSSPLFPRPALKLDQAVYPMYQDMASRRRSYPTWDETRAPPLNELILCGMYYAGYGDCVRCFYCGVGLKSWEVTDNVWTEHIRWRPNCGYVRAVKGDTYIRHVLDQISREAEGLGLEHSTPNRQNNDSIANRRPHEQPLHNNDGQQTQITTLSAGSGTTAAAAAHCNNIRPETTMTSNFGDETGGVTSSPTPTGASTDTLTPVSSVPSVAANSHNLQGNGGSDNEGHITPSELSRSSETFTGTLAQHDACKQEHERHENQELSRHLSCKLCHLRIIDTIFLPCGHLATCGICARTITCCPLCNDVIHGTARVETH